jgi:hypothetical protein
MASVRFAAINRFAQEKLAKIVRCVVNVGQKEYMLGDTFKK